MKLIEKIKKVLFKDDSSSPKQTKSQSQRDPDSMAAKKVGLVLSGDGRTFLEPEFDLEVIEKAYNTEAYVRQGIDKYIDKMFKSGWKFVGKNPNTVEYIRTRFAFMAETTQIPTDLLFIEYCEDVVKFSNAIIVKARKTDESQLPPNFNIVGYAGREPVVGYFPLNVTTMTVNRDQYGTIIEWQQEVSGAAEKLTFKPEDIIHTAYKRTKGNMFGTPFVTPVLDDIRSLREAEDGVLKMLYRFINPFIHCKLGTEEYPADDTEILAAKQEIEGMEINGGLVTSERWELLPVASDKVVDAEPYLKYFEARVFSGLGVPATMFGRGETANKSTSENQSSEFIDRVKAMQRVVMADINEYMIKELLYEGGFDPLLNPDDMVSFVFNEIDIDMQIKLENHAVFKYEHNAITEDEMRQLLSLDIITDRSKLFNELVTLYGEEQILKWQKQYAVPTMGMGGSSSSSSSSSSKSSSKSSSSTSSEKGSKETNNKVKPKNQHNPQGKEKTSKDEIVIKYLKELENNLNSTNSYSCKKVYITIAKDFISPYGMRYAKLLDPIEQSLTSLSLSNDKEGTIVLSNLINFAIEEIRKDNKGSEKEI